MAIRTSKPTGTVNHGGQSNAIKSGRVFSDIIFKPGDDLQSHVITVDQFPIHIFASIPRGYSMDTTRIYMGPSVDCIDIPNTKVPCLSGVIHNTSDEDMDFDMWIVQRGSYRFDLVTPGDDVVPDDTYIWYMFDDLAPCDECCKCN